MQLSPKIMPMMVIDRNKSISPDSSTHISPGNCRRLALQAYCRGISYQSSAGINAHADRAYLPQTARLTTLDPQIIRGGPSARNSCPNKAESSPPSFVAGPAATSARAKSWWNASTPSSSSWPRPGFPASAPAIRSRTARTGTGVRRRDDRSSDRSWAQTTARRDRPNLRPGLDHPGQATLKPTVAVMYRRCEPASRLFLERHEIGDENCPAV